MKQPISELTDYSGRACFINYNVLHRSLNYDWLKPYVLLYDCLIFDGRETLQHPIDYGNLETWAWLQKNSIYLEDFEGYQTHKEMTEFALQKLKGLAFTKQRFSHNIPYQRYNIAFLKTFQKKMAAREGGYSDQAYMFEFSPEYWKDPYVLPGRFNNIITNELLDAFKSGRVLYAAGISSVLDQLSSWLFRRAFSKILDENKAMKAFDRIIISHIPDFQSLPWKRIIELRDSPFRKKCLALLGKMPDSNGDAVQAELLKGFWQLATELTNEASIPKAVFKGVTGNIPFLPANPFSLAYAGLDVKNAKNRIDKYGWLFFISEIQQAAKKESDG